MTAEEALRQLMSPAGLADPYPLYRHIRSLAAVHHSDALGAHVVARHQECAQVLLSDDFGKQDPAWSDRHAPGWRESPAARYVTESMLRRNPPDHTRLRTLVNQTFTARRVAGRHAGIVSTVDQTLDRLADLGRADLQATVSFPVATAMIGDLVGVPAADQDQFRWLVDTMVRPLDPNATAEDRARADSATVTAQDYFRSLIGERRTRPRGDLASYLVDVHDSGDRLTDVELCDTLTLIFLAGLETVALSGGAGVAALLAHPEQRAKLVADPTLADAAVEEVLRWDGPFHILPRRVMRETVLANVVVPAETKVIMLVAAANRDPDRYAEPDVFDITRTRSRSLSFGGGIHYCLGAMLARLAASVLLPRIVRRFPDLRPDGEPELRPTLAIRGYHRFPVRVD